MNAATLIAEYVQNLKSFYSEAVRTGQMTPELSFRPVLDEFLSKFVRSINSSVERVFEPKQQAQSGRPDWRFYNSTNLGVYGYVEAKALDPKTVLDSKSHAEQIQKYRKLGQAVILTDGIDFYFYFPSGDRLKISLSEKPLTERKEWKVSQRAALLEQAFRRFLSKPSSRKISEAQLIEECAIRAQLLSEGIESLASVPKNSGMNATENQTIKVLHNLRDMVSKHHDPMMRNAKFFADFVSQVLIFGMIYTHRVIGSGDKKPKDKHRILRVFWEQHGFRKEIEQLRPFCYLGRQLKDELGTLGILGTWFEDCALMLSYVQLDEKQESQPDYHKLFESFFAKFDPKSRFDYGVFYTPPELTAFMVSLVEEIALRECPEIDLYDDRNKLMDPCCGTGSFLERMYISSEQKNHKPTIVGFEILPAPYALAHYRITMISRQIPENVRIVLTNTLSDNLESNPKQPQLGMLQQEQQEARALARPPLTLIIGNPPSSDSFHASNGANFSIIQELLDDFRPPASLRKGRQNIQKQVQNEHMKFLRWSANKILESERGIISLVLPLSFLDSTSYKFARLWLFNNLDNIYVVEIDRDARSGVRASSIFNTLQGRAVLIATRMNEPVSNKKKEFHYTSISELDKKDKLDLLIKMAQVPDKAVDGFSQHQASSDTASLRPLTKPYSQRYSKFWSLFQIGDSDEYIFQRHCSGLKLAPSSLFIHSAREMLMRRSQDIASTRKSFDDIHRKWYAGQDKPPSKAKFGEAVRKEFSNLTKDSTPTRYAYRPFLNTWSLMSESVLQELSKTGGGGTRYRPEVLSAFRDKATIGIAVAPSRRDIGERLHRFASFCWYLPDNDLCMRGNAHVFCNQFPVYKKKRQWNSTIVNNVNPIIIDGTRVTAEDVVFYTYAMLCATAYLDEFEGALFTGSDSEAQPRIPVVDDRKQFLKLTKLGRELAELEQPIKPDQESLIDWTAALYQDIDAEFFLHRFELDPAGESISLLDEHSKLVIELKPIPIDIIDYQIAGYRVVQQWLKFYSFRYTRTPFTSKELILLLGVLQNIRKQHEVIAEIDRHVCRIIQ